MWSLLLIILAAAQDAEVDRLVARLGDDAPAAREEAERKLIEKGERALPALRRALESADPEVRARAQTAVARIEEDAAHMALQRQQRPGKIVVSAGDHTEIPSNAAVTDGARFTFACRPWPAEGPRAGTIIETTALKYLDGNLEWEVAALTTGRGVETCDRHSPDLVYAPGEWRTGAGVQVKGLRRWYCDIPMRFDDPRDGDRRHAGPYTLVVRWPSIVVETDTPVSTWILPQMLSTSDITITFKEPEASGRYGSRLGGKRNSIARGPTPVYAWCGCAGQPAKETRKPPPMSREHAVKDPLRIYPAIEKVASISLTFHRPVEEPFEVTSPALK